MKSIPLLSDRSFPVFDPELPLLFVVPKWYQDPEVEVEMTELEKDVFASFLLIELEPEEERQYRFWLKVQPYLLRTFVCTASGLPKCEW